MDYTTITKNITVQQGATWKSDVIEVWETYAPPNGNVALAPADISLVRMQIREQKSSSSPVVSLDSDQLGGITVAQGVDTAEVRIRIEADQAAAIPFNQGVYDVEVVFTDGDTERILEGTVTVSKEVTRA